MKSPFEFAKELLRFTREELSDKERAEVERVLKEKEGLEDLARELKDKEQISREIGVMGSFDTGKALKQVNRKRGQKRHLFIPWVAAASVVLVAGVTALFLLNRAPKDAREVISVARVDVYKRQDIGILIR